MADVASLGIVVELKDGQLVARHLDDITAAAGRTEQRASSLEGVWKKLAGVFSLGLMARAELANIIEAQNAMAQLEARVKSTGGAAGLTVRQLDDLSMSLQEVGVQSDEAVKGGEALLLTFNKIKGDTFSRATADILDVAQALGGDLQGAAIQVGKALQDPATGLLALRRSGVSFSEAQQQVIKDLFNTGHEAKAQAMILAELEKEFGGSAAAARNTLGGALKGLGHDFGDLFERTTEEMSGIIAFIKALDSGVRNVHIFRTEVLTATEVLGAAGLLGVLYKLGSGTDVAAFLSLAGSVRTYTEAVALGQAATVGLGATVSKLAVSFGPLALLAGAAALAIYDLNKAFEEHDDAVEEATKNTPEYVAYLKALGHAHSQAGGAGQLVKPVDPGAADAALALQKLLAAQALELEKLTALNRVYGQSDLALATLALRYDAMIEKAKFVEGHTSLQIAAFNKVTDAIRDQKIVALENAAGVGLAALAATDLAARTPLLTATVGALRVEWAQANKGLIATVGQYQAVMSIESLLIQKHNEIKASLDTLAAKNKATADAQQKETAESIAAQQKFNETMHHIWSGGLEKIVTDGTKTFHDFFEDVLQLFSRLMDTMAERAKALGKEVGAQYKALAAGSAAIAGGVAGYQIGQQTGSSAIGALGGAASGAMIGNEILPGGWGAAIGGLAGAAGGLLGAAEAQRKAAEQLKAAADAFRNKADTFVFAGAPGGDVAAQLLQIKATARALVDEARDLQKPGGISLTEFVDRANAIADSAARQAKKMSDDFWLGIGQQLTALAGPMGAYVNSLNDIFKQHSLNVGVANALAVSQGRLGASAEELTEIDRLQTEQIKALDEAMAFALLRDKESLEMRRLQAQGATAEVRALQEQMEIEDAIAAKKSAEYIIDLKLTQAIEDETKAKADAAAAAEKLTQSIASLTERYLALTGQTDAASTAGLLESQRQARNAATPDEMGLLLVVQMFDRAQLAVQQQLAVQTKVQQDSLKVSQDSLGVATQSLASLRSAADSLKAYSNSMKLGPLSSLSPLDQLAAAKSQLEDLFKKAQGGDTAAAGQFGSAADAYRQLAQNAYSSTPAYVAVDDSVQAMADTLAWQFDSAASLQQQTVDALNTQISLLQTQVAQLTDGNSIAELTKQAVITSINEARDTALEANGPLIDQFNALRETLTGVALDIVTAERNTLVGNQNNVSASAQAEIDAITRGDTAQNVALYDQIRLLDLQKASTDGGFAQQIATQGALLGFDSPTVQNLVKLQQEYDAGVNAQLTALYAQLHQDATLAALARQTYVVGSPQDPNFMGMNASDSVQNGGNVTYASGLPPWNPLSPTGQALALEASHAAGGGSGKVWIPGQGWVDPRQDGNQFMLDPNDEWYTSGMGPSVRAEMKAAGYPGFASGGDFGGGIMRVHDRELVMTGGARVLNAGQSGDVLASASGAGRDQLAELRLLRSEVKALRTELVAATRDQTRTQRTANARRQR